MKLLIMVERVKKEIFFKHSWSQSFSTFQQIFCFTISPVFWPVYRGKSVRFSQPKRSGKLDTSLHKPDHEQSLRGTLSVRNLLVVTFYSINGLNVLDSEEYKRKKNKKKTKHEKLSNQSNQSLRLRQSKSSKSQNNPFELFRVMMWLVSPSRPPRFIFCCT